MKTALEDVEPRYQTPDPTDMPCGSMRVSDVETYIHDILECGRKKNAKTEIFKEICERFDPIDYYWFCRMYSGEQFAEPDFALGVGKALVGQGISAKMMTEGELESLRDEYNTLFDAFNDRDIHDGDEDMLLTVMYDELFRLAKVTSDKGKAHQIGKIAAKTRHPCVWLKMLDDAPAMFVYGDNILKGCTKSSETDIPYGRVDERARMLGDVPLAVWEAISDTREFQMRLEPHQKLGEMKAESKLSAGDIYDSVGIDSENWVAQTKYDGARVFVHNAGDGDYRAYLAGGRDVTAELPELYRTAIHDELPDVSFIFDCEAVPYDAETGDVLPFQEILKRAGREGSIDLEDEDVEVRFKFFDVLYYDDADIRFWNYVDRLDIIRDTFAPPRVARTGTNLEAAFHRSVERGHEGVVMKQLDSEIEMDTRSDVWQKWKADPMEVDCKIYAVYEGSGRLTDSVGALGLRLETEKIATPVSVGRVGTGFSDAKRKRLWKRNADEGIIGDTVQISFEELQYNEDGGWALRFPSFDALRPEGEVDRLKRVATEMAHMDDEYEEWVARR